MEIIKKIKGWFKKESPQQEPEKPNNQIIEQEPIRELDTRQIMKDKDGEDLVCEFCNNWDNQTNKYYPIYEGEQKTFNGKKYHLDCHRYLKKHIKELI
jgi:hypothetical protein